MVPPKRATHLMGRGRNEGLIGKREGRGGKRRRGANIIIKNDIIIKNYNM